MHYESLLYNTPNKWDVLLTYYFFSFLNESLGKEPKILTQIEHKDSQFAI